MFHFVGSVALAYLAGTGVEATAAAWRSWPRGQCWATRRCRDWSARWSTAPPSWLATPWKGPPWSCRAGTRR